eukprot:CAMPEP_0119075870 /NCGR_PEP_ID=MMETSP1178-20130426/83442_1 /TAXON_ID=33656 /ORGANISM="unid sp, Strain CCMP2000" /LENGTH=51 /DNA_ID=CAMNT_0007058121 /DNA_START=79 /DNA_END=230 /DNA_ORIENTATION=+
MPLPLRRRVLCTRRTLTCVSTLKLAVSDQHPESPAVQPHRGLDSTLEVEMP